MQIFLIFLFLRYDAGDMQIQVFTDARLKDHTFYGVGGVMDEFYQIHNFEAFMPLWQETLSQKIPFLFLGKGSNLLCSDRGFRGRVFYLARQNVHWKTPDIVEVDAGKNAQDFIQETNQKGWDDLCLLSGIPGNIGGFIRGNAGAFGRETVDNLLAVHYLDENAHPQILKVRKEDFGYRESIFKKNPHWCILRGVFQMKSPAEAEKALTKTKTLLQDRWKKYPPGRSGGSFFKNPDGDYAGRLLESVGAKGDRIGHAQIAEKHANFIVNLEGKALQKDILTLARKWKQKVQEVHKITLEPEIFICDEYGKKVEL